MDINQSKVAEWYKGRNILITGGTGFMGKVLIEKLLYSCPDIGNIYILMRSKRGKNPEQRIEEIWKLPIFNRLKELNPNARQKIIPINGDLVSANLGLEEKSIEMITENISIVFHCAATLKLEATLKDALQQNTTGTKKIIHLVKQIKHLDAFIHMSTAFCSADLNTFEEKVYKSPHKPADVMELPEWLESDILSHLTPSLIQPHPNTYTYTKRLAETLVAEECSNIRAAIVRPSVVTPAMTEPVPGWVDNLNGPVGLMVAAGKGVLRSMHANGEYKAQVIPVDIAINAMLLVAYKTGSSAERPKDLPVYNLTSESVMETTWSEILTLGKSACHKYPFEQMIWYPDGDIRASYLMHRICCFFFHWIPAYFIDFLLLIFMQKRFMIRVQKKIHDGLELLQFFTTREWDFRNGRFLALHDDLSEVDREIFQLDFSRVSKDKYIDNCVLGARQYCMKENPKTLPRCRFQQGVLYVLDKVLKIVFYSSIIWFALVIMDSTRNFFYGSENYTGDMFIKKTNANI